MRLSGLALVALLAFPPASQAQATWNPLDKGGGIALSNGNLSAAGSGNVWNLARATFGRSTGKYCFEIVYEAADVYASVTIGMANASASLSGYAGQTSASFGVQWQASAIQQPLVSGVTRAAAFSASVTAVVGDRVTICADLDSDVSWLARNGSWVSGNPASGTNPTVTGMAGTWFPAMGGYNAANRVRIEGYSIVHLPAGFAPWSDAPPSGGSGIPPDSPYPVQAPVWTKVTELWLNSGPVRQPVGPGMFSTCWSASGSCAWWGPQPDTWHLVDLTVAPWNVPTDAKWAFLRGLTIMTAGNRGESAHFGVVFRKPGDTSVPCTVDHYAVLENLDNISPTVGAAGERDSTSVTVPLVAGKFEMCWHRYSSAGDFPGWPASTTFAWTATLTGWAR